MPGIIMHKFILVMLIKYACSMMHFIITNDMWCFLSQLCLINIILYQYSVYELLPVQHCKPKDRSNKDNCL